MGAALMWYVLQLVAGNEYTLLCTRYRDIARLCAALLPGTNIVRFVPDNWYTDAEKDFSFPAVDTKSAK